MEYTKEQQEDFDERAKAFGLAFEKLCKKHKCEFVPIPKYVRGPNGVWVTGNEIHIGDTKHKPIESPISQLIEEGI